MSERQPIPIEATEEPGKLAENKEAKDISEWPPLELRENGFIYDEKGKRVSPDFAVGQEKHHKLGFIEYERTFGRGVAKNLTHNILMPHEIEKYGEDFQKDYRSLANQAMTVLVNGTREEINEFTSALKEYRQKYPFLYEDVKRSNEMAGRNLEDEIKFL